MVYDILLEEHRTILYWDETRVVSRMVVDRKNKTQQKCKIKREESDGRGLTFEVLTSLEQIE